MFQPPKVEADNLRLFFERFGGYTAFVKKALNEHGYIIPHKKQTTPQKV